MDFGYALVKLAGSLRKVAFFALALPYSDAMFIAAYPRECTETFQDGHVRALLTIFIVRLVVRAFLAQPPKPVHTFDKPIAFSR